MQVLVIQTPSQGAISYLNFQKIVILQRQIGIFGNNDLFSLIWIALPVAPPNVSLGNGASPTSMQGVNG